MIVPRVVLGRWRALRNTLLPGAGRRSPRRAMAARAAAVLGLLLGVMAYLVVHRLLSLLIDDGGGLADAVAAIAAIVNFTLVGLFVFDLHEGLSALLSDSDLDLLRRAPIRPAALLGLKLLDALPRTSLLLLVLVAPSVAAFHTLFHLPGWAWLLLPFQLVALWAIPLGLGTAASLLLLRHVPARHAREALGLVSSLTLFALWLANSFLLPRIGTAAAPVLDVRATLARLTELTSPTPGAWMAHALESAAGGDLGLSLLATLAILGAGSAAVLLALAIASRDLESVQTRILSGGGRREDRSPRVRRVPSPGVRGLVPAMLARDGHLIARHWTILGDLLTTAVLWTLLPVVAAPLFDASREMLARAMLLGLTVAIGNEIAARVLPLERRALAWSRLAPVAPARWLLARLAGAGIFAALLLALATAGTVRALELDSAQVLRLIAVLVPALLLALATGVWAGAAFGDPAWSNPRSMLTPAGRVIATLSLVAQAVGWLLLAGAMPDMPGPIAGRTLQLAAGVFAAALGGIAFMDASRRLANAEPAWA